MLRGKEILAALRAHRLAREQKSPWRPCAGTAAISMNSSPVVYDDVAGRAAPLGAPDLGSTLIKLAARATAPANAAPLAAPPAMTGPLAMLLHAVSVRAAATNGSCATSPGVWQPGKRWALLGDNGAGKTSCSLLSGDVWPTPRRPDSARNAGRRSKDRAARRHRRGPTLSRAANTSN